MSEMKIGNVCWSELMTPDLEGSKKFYGDLFGWETSEMEMDGGFVYTMFRPAGASEKECTGGMMQITPEMEGCPPHWLSYVLVEDVTAAVAKATSLGATIIKIKEVTDLPTGRLAIFKDPHGACLACYEVKKSG